MDVRDPTCQEKQDTAMEDALNGGVWPQRSFADVIQGWRKVRKLYMGEEDDYDFTEFEDL